MKKYLLIATVLLLMLFTACTAPQPPVEPAPEPAPMPSAQTEPEPAPQFEVPTFQLSALPQLEPYEAPREIINRYYDEGFVDILRPADDYGHLLPYAGKIFGQQWWESRIYYGLTDEQGRVVVDAVYNSAYFTPPEQNGGKSYLILNYPVDMDDEDAQQRLRESDGWIQRSRYQIAATDGSWVSDIYYGDSLSISEERIIVSNYGDDMSNFWRAKDQSYRIYDMEGQLISSGAGQLGEFYDGRARLCYSLNDDWDAFCYLDRDGMVAIPGPFLDANIFVNGRATVDVGSDYEHRSFAVINTAGEYVVEPNPERINIYNGSEKYHVFVTQGNGDNRGIKDSDGNIIAPAIYSWMSLPYNNDSTVAIASKADNSYWLIDMISGETTKIEIEGATVNHGWVVGGNWCVVNYTGGTALLKGDEVHRFDIPDGDYVDCRDIFGYLFAISGTSYDEKKHPTYYVDIFDAAQGKVIHSFTDMQYYHLTEEVLLMSLPPHFEYYRAYNLDYTPAFNGELAGDTIISLSHLHDDIYSVRTVLYSGLIRQNGDWLLRILVNNID